MRTVARNLICLLAAPLILTACLPVDENEASYIEYDVESILRDRSLSDGEKSEKLARVGEALFNPSGFMFADEVLDLSLKYDAMNSRARLYKSLGGPIREMKGILNRIDPLAAKFSRENYARFVELKRVAAINPSVKRYLNAGPRDLRNESRAQAWLNRVRGKQNELREHLRDHRDFIVIKPTIFRGEDIALIWKSCPIAAIERANGYHRRYRAKVCPFMARRQMIVDLADYEALQHIAAGLQIATAMSVAYDGTGGAKFDRYLARNPYVTAAGLSRVTNRLGDFGRLKDAAAMQLVHSLGSDFYAGARWIQSHQDQLCPKGWNEMQRPGSVFAYGLCTKDYPSESVPKSDVIFESLRTALAGGLLAVAVSGHRAVIEDLETKPIVKSYRTDANLLAPFISPVADLRGLLPTNFDRCGNGLNTGSDSAGGALPRGDATTFFSHLGWIKKPCP